jgi:signal peptidase I
MKISKKIGKEIVSLSFMTLIILIIAIILRIFVFAGFAVVSSSMEPAVLAGEYIIVNKQIPGPRVYTNLKQMRRGELPETRRFSGIREVRRNDVLVFNEPEFDDDCIKMRTDINYVKRCIGLPGDTIAIVDGFYRLKNAPGAALGNIDAQRNLSTLNPFLVDPSMLHCFPSDNDHYRWNIWNFGPLYVPAKDAQIAIDTINIALYSRLLCYETGLAVSVCNGSVCIADSAITTYTFRHNYYFMVGDNVANSGDSRFWGLLPEDHIIGKAVLVFSSKDMKTGKPRLSRFFKIIE